MSLPGSAIPCGGRMDADWGDWKGLDLGFGVKLTPKLGTRSNAGKLLR